MGGQVARGNRQGLVRQECRPVQQCRPALQPHALLEVDEAGWRRRQDPGRSRKEDHFRSRRRGQDEGRFRPGRRHPVRVGLGVDRRQGRQAHHHEDAERREPAGARRQAGPRLRRVGALLLHRLPQPPARLPQGLSRPSGQLGPRGRDVCGGEQVAISARPMSPVAQAERGDTPRFSFAHVADLLAVLVLIGVAAIAALTFRDYGLGWDDFTHAQYGDLLLKLYGSGFADRRAFGFVNLYMYGGGFDMLAALAAKILPFDLFATRRLVGAAVGLVGLAATWRIGRRIGGPTAGLIALVLLATCPLYYGHMFMNPKDAPFAAAMALLLLALVRAIEDYPRPTPATVALFAIGLGLTIGSRIIGGMAAIYAAAAVALIVAVEARALGVRAAGPPAGRFIVVPLPGLVIAYAVMALVWPWAVVDPLNPIRSLEYFSVFLDRKSTRLNS